MLDLQWQREREGGREGGRRKRGREGGREIENYLIEENFFREKFQGFFFRFRHFFPMECFLDQNYP